MAKAAGSPRRAKDHWVTPNGLTQWAHTNLRRKSFTPAIILPSYLFGAMLSFPPTFAFVSERIAEAIGFPDRWAPYCSKLRFQFAAVLRHSRSLLTLSFMADRRDNWKHNGFRQMVLTHRPASSFLMQRELTVYVCNAAFSKSVVRMQLWNQLKEKTLLPPNLTTT